MELLIRNVREEYAACIVELLNPIIQAGIYTVMDEQMSIAKRHALIRDLYVDEILLERWLV
ncbi:MAG: hypothetical protein ABI986_06475 [Chloroflexota bacterium]